jgi:hypothetical protein
VRTTGSNSIELETGINQVSSVTSVIHDHARTFEVMESWMIETLMQGVPIIDHQPDHYLSMFDLGLPSSSWRTP